MAPSQTSLKTNFKPVKVIQPFYTGGKVALDRSGRILVTTLNEDVLITDLETGDELARIEGVSRHAEFLGNQAGGKLLTYSPLNTGYGASYNIGL